MKLALTAASLLLVASGALACGSDEADSDSAGDDTSSSATSSDSASAESSDDASDDATDDSDDSGDASVDEFCTAFEEFATALVADPNASEADQIRVLKEEAEKLGDVDTPDGIPDDAKDGFEAVIDAIADLPDDATLEDLSALEEGFSEEETANADAFDTYLEETCPDLGGGEAESVEPAPSLSPNAPAPSVESSPAS